MNAPALLSQKIYSHNEVNLASISALLEISEAISVWQIWVNHDVLKRTCQALVNRSCHLDLHCCGDGIPVQSLFHSFIHSFVPSFSHLLIH